MSEPLPTWPEFLLALALVGVVAFILGIATGAGSAVDHACRYCAEKDGGP